MSVRKPWTQWGVRCIAPRGGPDSYLLRDRSGPMFSLSMRNARLWPTRERAEEARKQAMAVCGYAKLRVVEVTFRDA